MAKDFYKNAKKLIGKIGDQNQKLQEATYIADTLPSTLKNEFRKRQDPKLNNEIIKAEQNVLGGAIQGLNKYQHIVNPFKRRALAEDYQKSLSYTHQSLIGERERRQGVIQDYIKMWSDSYSAVAKAQQLALQGIKDEYGSGDGYCR